MKARAINIYIASAILLTALVVVTPASANTNVAQAAQSQAVDGGVRIPITVTDGTYTKVVTFGTDAAGTDGLDTGIDQTAPPPPPTGAFDARLRFGGEDFLRDLRAATLDPKTYNLIFAGPNAGATVLSWDPTSLDGLGTFVMQVKFGENFAFGPIDMTAQSSVSAADYPALAILAASGIQIIFTPAPPVLTATDDSATTEEDMAVVIDILGNDIDPAGGMPTISAISTPGNGAVVDNSDGSVTYTPGLNFNGSDTFTYTITSGTDSETATVSVTVTPVNDAPVLMDDSGLGDEDTSVANHVLENDEDVDGDMLTVTAVTDGQHGTVEIQPDGSLLYTPDADFHGDDQYTYTASDGTLDATAAVFVTVTPVNDNPVANDDDGFGDEDNAITIDVLAGDTDVDGDNLSVSAATTPGHGSAEVQPDGTIIYTPDADYSGPDSFEYTVSDGNGGTDDAMVTITVHPINDNPVAVDDNATTQIGEPVVISPLVNDSDVDGDTISLTSITQPMHGSATDNTDGTVTYTPDGTFVGQDSFEYTISDGNGGSATGTIKVSALNAADDAVETDEDTAITFDPTENDTDPENDPISVTAVGTPGHGTATAENNSVTYTPEADFNGTDSFTYSISDGAGSAATGTITVTVAPVNDAPVADDDTATGTEDAGPITLNVLTNDSDVDGDDLTSAIATQPANGTATVGTDGATSYTPNANFFGTDAFDYTVSDGSLTDTGTVTITVTPVPDTPVAVDDTGSGSEDTDIMIDVLANDFDVDSDALTVSATTPAANGTVTIGTGGMVTYSPNANYHGTDSFTYTVADGTGRTAIGTVTATITPVNDAPVATADVRRAFEGSTATFDLDENDFDVDGDEFFISSVGTAAGTVEIGSDGLVDYTPPDDALSDSFTYTIDDGNGLTATATVTISIVPLPPDDDGVDESIEAAAPNGGDGNNDGVPDSEQANVASLPGPTGGYVTIATNTGTELQDVQVSNDNPSPADTPAEATFPAGFVNYKLAGGTGNKKSTVSVIIPDGVIFNSYYKYGPTPDNTTPHWYNFLYDGVTGAVIDGNKVTLHFVDGKRGDDDLLANGVIQDPGAPALTPNKVPVLVTDSVTLDEDQTTLVDVLNNDSDPDSDPLTLLSVGRASKGSARIETGKVRYTPTANANGADSFTYVVSDGQGASMTSTVNVTINPINDLPIAVDDEFTIDEDASVDSSNLVVNDTDVDGDVLTVSAATLTSGDGAVVVNSDGTVTFTPTANWFGSAELEYTVSDGNGGTDSGIVVITVNSVNDAPVAADDTASTEDNVAVSIDALFNDTDVEEDPLTLVEINTAPEHGTAAIDSGAITYTPGLDYVGDDSFTYVVSDGTVTDTASVAVTVTLGPKGPSVAADEVETLEDVELIIDVLSNDSDANGDKLFISAVSEAPHGTVTINPDSTLTYTPEANYFGSDTFTYTASDGGLTAEGSVTVEITSVNDLPSFGDDGAFISPEDGATVVVGGDTESNAVDPATAVVFEFREAIDVDGDALTYTWEVATDAAFTDLVTGLPPLEGTSVSFTVADLAVIVDGVGAELGVGLTLYHRITVDDGQGTPVEVSATAIFLRGYVTGLYAEGEVPEVFALHGNYPNPFNPTTNIRFDLPIATDVRLEVYDVLGRRVATLVNGHTAAGFHEIAFDASRMPSGLYVYTIKAEGFAATRTMVLTK